MKKSSLISLGALVALSVFLFTACPEEGEESPPPAPTTYTVTFNTGAEGPSVPPVTVTSGGKISKPTDPSKATVSFGGWYKDSAFKSAWDFDKDTVTADASLYAKWVARVTVQNTKEGTADVAAVYTITISKALEAGETLVITNAKRGSDVTYTPASKVTTPKDQADALVKLFKNGLYDAVRQGSNAVKLTAKTAGVIDAPEIDITPPAVGAVTAGTFTAGSSSGGGSKSSITITIATALTTDETLTITNVLSSGDLEYTPSDEENTATLQGDAVVNLIKADTASKYTAANAAGAITIEGAANGLLPEPKAVVTSDASVTGKAVIANTVKGADAVAAEYTITVNSALPVGELLTFTNVVSDSELVYQPQATATTVAAQITAIKTLISNSGGVYDVLSSTSKSIKLGAQTPGVIENVPTATVTVAPEEEEQAE